MAQPTSATIKMWVYVLRKPRSSSIHSSPYVCISGPFTARWVNLLGQECLTPLVASRRYTAKISLPAIVASRVFMPFPSWMFAWEMRRVARMFRHDGLLSAYFSKPGALEPGQGVGLPGRTHARAWKADWRNWKLKEESGLYRPQHC